jgi:hypothetical protein
VVWEVLGHLELLLSAGIVREASEAGAPRFALTSRTGRPHAGVR